MDALIDSSAPNFAIHSSHHAHHHSMHHGSVSDASVSVNAASPQMHSMSMSMSMPMPMYFQWSTDVTILFEQWHVDTPGWYTVTAVAIFLLGLFYEWLITFRQGYEQRMHAKRLESDMEDLDALDLQTSSSMKRLLQLSPKQQAKAVNENLQHLVAAALHVLQLSIAYALMLVVMTYNVGLTVAVIAGAGAGYFLFARLRRSIVINEAGCH